ncbi:capsular biosynthesis protein [Burkholderia sp. Ac-20344]|uniref:capsule biosynthesis protein n=1 Tax=Burkholderia sp. Ac-20344 TaxID=2703890 RepID=UPI00197B08EE|nr:capsular biosynthesis protein [Burkholderia sp. Ac-20344]MBN3833343.1 capsular biosynthesis protein [Burkholderia sp. Ac-20344]
MHRSFLALQGTASPFFGQLASALRDRGHAVRRVNFCGGDLAYSCKGPFLNYSGRASDLPGWYREMLQAGSYSDILMFGDCREVHAHVHPISQAMGVKVHVFEEGYVRPHWLTLEAHGVNGRSLLPRDPKWYFDQRSVLPPSPAGLPTGYNLYERSLHDIRYRAANAFYAAQFPNYKSHRPKNGVVEYAGLGFRALQQGRHRREATKVTKALLDEGCAYYLFPLQLNSDAQIVFHSPFDGVCSAIDRVMRSFAAHAPEGSLLVIKNHPLDTGLINYRRFVAQLAGVLGLADRLRFIDSGHLPTLLERARGVVVVNSTVGLSAVHHCRPLITLGTAIYDIQGLTWQGTLEDFWTQADRPDMALYQAFLDYIMHHTQINGDFYTRSGIAMAVERTVIRLEAARV